MPIINYKLNRLTKSIEVSREKLKEFLTSQGIEAEEHYTLRKLIRLIPTKKIYPQRLSNNLYGHTSVGLFVNDVLITGGARDKNNVLNDNFILSIDKNIKTNKLSLDLGRQKHTAVKIDDNNVLFSGGIESGIGDGSRINKHQQFNINSNTFTNKIVLPSSVERHSGCLIGNNVYYLGGVFGGGWGNMLNAHYEYSISTNTFTNKATFGGYAGQTVVKINNNSYILFGGQTNPHSVVANYCKIYNVNNNTFTNKTSLSESRSTLTSIDLKNGTTLISGGFKTLHAKSNKNEIYNINANNYTAKANLNPSRSDHSAVYLGSGGALIGGKASLSSEEVVGTPLNLIEFYNYYDNAFYKAGDN